MTGKDHTNLKHYLESRVEKFWADVVYVQVRNFTIQNRAMFFDFKAPKSRKSSKWGYLTSLSFDCTCAIIAGEKTYIEQGTITYKRLNGHHVVDYVTNNKARGC